MQLEGQRAQPFARTYFHGTKADLRLGERVEAGFASNFGARQDARYTLLTATLDAAI